MRSMTCPIPEGRSRLPIQQTARQLVLLALGQCRNEVSGVAQGSENAAIGE